MYKNNFKIWENNRKKNIENHKKRTNKMKRSDFLAAKLGQRKKRLRRSAEKLIVRTPEEKKKRNRRGAKVNSYKKKQLKFGGKR